MRNTINLIYDYDERWIGGTYYILNIIKVLNTLNEEIKPKLRIIVDRDTPFQLVDQIDYPLLEKVIYPIKPTRVKSFLNKFYKRIAFEDFFKKQLPNIDGSFYPLNGGYEIEKDDQGKFYWIPDFQERHLPEYFSPLQKRLRKRSIERLIINNCNIVFSSETALNDFKVFYPSATNKLSVLRFGSIISSNYKRIDIANLITKFGLKKPYLFCPNQLWRHKNHTVVIEAMKIIRKTDPDVQIVFTGKEFDHRHPNYAENLKNDVKESGLSEQVKFLGFIDRNEQLQLMNHAVAVIQPSRFEGWSTVVEDSKALNKFLIASDIPIHREQATENCNFFDMDSPSELATTIKNYIEHPIKPVKKDYTNNITLFAKDLMQILLQEN